MKNFYIFLVLLLIGNLSFGQITENFDSGLAGSYTTGNQTLSSGTWTTSAVIAEAAGNSRGGTGSAARINDDVAGASLTTPVISSGAGVVTFWYRELNTGGGTFALQTSTDGTTYTTQTTQAFSGTTYTQFTYTLNDASPNLTIRILNDNQSGHLIIDDFDVTTYSAPVNSIVIGTGTSTTGSTAADPIHGYYNAFRYQVVYTAAELSTTLTPNDEITALGWSIAGDYAGGNLLGYTIKMGHTTASNSASHNTASTIVVKNAFNYDPTVTTAGVFDMIPFDTNFVWNGVDNVLVEVCSDGPNPFSGPYGQVRTTTVTNGSRHYRVDGNTACGSLTNSINNNRPNIQFNYVDGIPPACVNVSGLTIDSFTDTTANISWTVNGTETDWEIVIQPDGTGLPTGAGTATATNPHVATGLSEQSPYEVYVRADCGIDGFSDWVGPVDFTTLPSCPDVTGLTLGTVTDTTAAISWTAGGTENAWEIVVQADGTGTPTGAGTSIATNPYTQTGLTASTDYEVYVRADCTSESNGYSNWVGPIDFRTTATPITAFPYTQNFDAGAAGWSVDNTINGSWQLGPPSNTIINSAHSGANAWVTNLTGTYNSSEDSYVISPPFNFSSIAAPVIELSVWWNSEFSWDGMVLQSSIDNGSTWQVVGANGDPNNWYNDNTIGGTPGGQQLGWTGRNSTSNGSNGWVIAKHNLTGLGGQSSVFLRLAFGSNGSVNDEGVAFDSVNIYQPACPDVSAITIDSLTDTEAVISWNAGNTETAWEIAVQTDGTGTPTGAGTGISSNPYTATSLTAETAYEVYVRADCGANGFSDWVGPVDFTTECPTVSALPFTEDVETTSTTLSCWSIVNNNGDNDSWSVNTSATYANSGTQSFRMYTDINGGSNDDYLISPKITLTGNEQLKFEQRVHSSGEPNDFTVLLSTTGKAPADFTNTILANASYSNTTYQELTIDLSAYTGDVYIAFHVPPGGLDGWYLYIDDITVEAIPSCLNPTGLTLDSFTDSTATISWTAGGTETDWEIVVQADGTGVPTTGTAIAANPYTYSGLTAETAYEVYLRADCGVDGFSDWIGPIDFTTPCSPIIPEYVADMSTNVPDSCWEEAGSGEVATGPGSIGASDWRQGTSYAFGPSNAINLWQSVDREWLLSPTFDLSTGGPYQLEVNVAVTNYNSSTVGDTMGSDDEVQLLSSTDGGITWVNITTWNAGNQPAVTGTEYVEDLTAITGNVQFAIWASDGSIDNTEDYDFHVGKFRVRAIPSCDEVTAVTIDNFTQSEATISWTAGDIETDWEIVVQPDGTGTPTGAGTAKTATTHTETGLTAQTAYEVYVRANCGANGFSAWVGPATFTTLIQNPIGVSCTSGSSSFIYTAEFDAFDGWTGDLSASTDGTWEIPGNATSTGTGPSAAFSGSNYMNYEASGSTTATASAVSPAIDLTTAVDGVELSFYMHAYGGDMGTLNVGVSFSASGPFTTLFTQTGELQTSATDPWVPVGINLDAYLGQIIYVEFSHTGTGGYEGDMSIDYMRVEACGAFCVDPSNVSVSNISDVSADIGWTVNGSETDWEIVIQAPGTGTPGGAGTSISTNPYTATGLTAETDYEIYLRADCGGSGFSDWVGPVNFTTACLTISTLPFTEDVETTSSTLDCWSIVNNNADTDTWSVNTSATYANSGTQSFQMYTDFNGGANDDYLISPKITLTGNERLKFQQRVRSATEPNDFTVLLSTTGSDLVDFTNTILANASYSNTTYQEIIIDLSAYSGDVYIAFHVPPAGLDGYYLYIDDITVEAIPSCFDVSALTVDSFTDTTATISWTANSSETDWEIVVQAPGTGTPGGPGTATSTNPHTLTGLTQDTAYEVYVRADCLGNGFSLWSGPVNFSTLCSDIIPNYFADMSASLPDSCWSEATNGEVATGPTGIGSSSWKNTGTGDDNNYGAGIFSNRINIFGTTAIRDWLISPTFDLSTGGPYQLELNVAVTNYNDGDTDDTMGADDEVQLLMSTDGGTTWANLTTWNVGNEPIFTGTEYVEDLTAYSGSVQFAIWASNGTTSGQDYDFHVGQFIVRTPPTCLEVSGITIDSTTASDVTVSWTAGSIETDWEIIVQPDGTGTPISAGTATANNPHTVSGLTDNTAYEVYVRADCDIDGFSAWVGPVDFTTDCGVFTAPYSEDFENAGALPDCWTLAGDDTWQFSNTSSFTHIGNNGTLSGSTDSGGYFAWLDDSTPDATNAELRSPFVDLTPLTTPALSFFEISDNEGFSNATLTVDVWDGAAWNLVGTYNTNTSGWEEKLIDLSGLTFTGPAQVRFVIADSGQFYDDIAIDDVKFDELPTCFEPTALTVDTFTRDSATVSWTANTGETDWEVVIQPDGTGTPTGAGTPTTTNPHLFTGLTAATDYEVYVRANCGPSDLSLWAGPLTFTTANPLPTTVATLDVTSCGTAGTDSYSAPYDASLQNVVWVQLNYTAGCPSLTIDTIGSDFDTEIGIYDANGVFIGSNDSGGTGITPQSLFTELGLANGTYYIAAGQYNVTFGADFNVTSSNTTQTGTIYINASGQSTATADYVNLQFPYSGAITEGGNHDVYAQIYEPGITDAVGQGANVEAWIGYNTTDATSTSDFTTGWTWIAATYNADQGNNDEYFAEIGSALTPGVHYYVSRFSVDGGPYSYGGKYPANPGGNFWDGTTAVSGQLTVNSASTPTTVATLTINGCGVSDSYNAAYDASVNNLVWVELVFDGNCNEITVDTESTTGLDTEIGLYDSFGNLIGNNDDGGTGTLSLLTENNLPAGTYYIVAGDYNINFGSTNFNATSTENSATGTLYINASTPNYVDYCNLQSPSSGSTVVGGNYDVYAQIYEPGVTEAAGQGANVQAWIGYSTTDATDVTDFTSGWTWVTATYNTDVGNNDEYVAEIGSGLAIGNYYYVSRFTVDGGPYAYGGIISGGSGGGFWDGTTHVSGQLTVNPLPEPTNHVLAFTAVADSDSQITLTWNDNDGTQPADAFLIVGKTGTGVFTTVVDGTDVPNDTDWSDDEFEFNRASGLQTYVVVGLEASTLYEFEIYPYTNSGSLIDFKTDGTVPSASATTNADPCLVAVTTFPYEEGFESGLLPQCWSQEVEAGSASWTFNNGAQGGAITSAHTGSFNALFYDTSRTGVVKLVSPMLDLTGITSPTLSFFHAQEAWGSDQDELRVYYKTSAAGSWTLIPGQTFTSSINTWTQETIALPNPSADYYIAFEGTGDYGRGVVLDDVRVEEVLAVTYTYNGTWSPSDPNGVSTINDDIIITSGDATISATTAIKTVTVNPGSSLTVDTGFTLTADDNITLESTSTSYSSLINNGTITGTINYERYVNANSGGNDLIAPPLSGQTWANFLSSGTNASDLLDNGLTGPTTYAFGPFDKAVNQYINYTDATSANLISGKGYRAATDSGTTLTFSGTIPSSPVNAPISFSGPTYPDWNLIGNPFPSYISIFNFLFTEVGSTGSGVYNFNLLATGSGLYGYDGNAADGWDVITLANAGSRLMAPGQGFLIAADPTNSATYDISFDNAIRATGNSDDFIAGRSDETLTYFKLNTSTSNQDYTTQFYFDDNASQGLDHGYDGKILGDVAPSFALYSHLVQDNVGVPMALQALNPTDMMDVVIPLGVNANAGEQLTFTITESMLASSVEVYLDDTVNNTSTLLTATDYVITPSTDLNGTGRFYLRVSDSALSISDADFNSIKIYTQKSPRVIFIHGIIGDNTIAKIHDIQGRLVLSTELDSNNLLNQIETTNFQDGVYVVTLTNGSREKSQKVIIR